jgi:hypothetical protein
VEPIYFFCSGSPAELQIQDNLELFFTIHGLMNV